MTDLEGIKKVIEKLSSEEGMEKKVKELKFYVAEKEEILNKKEEKIAKKKYKESEEYISSLEVLKKKNEKEIEETKKKIERLTSNLSIIIKIAGFKNREEFSCRIGLGLSRLSMIKNGHTIMDLAEYVIIRVVLERFKMTITDNTLYSVSLYNCLDSNDLDEEISYDIFHPNFEWMEGLREELRQ